MQGVASCYMLAVSLLTLLTGAGVSVLASAPASVGDAAACAITGWCCTLIAYDADDMAHLELQLGPVFSMWRLEI